MKVLFTLVLFIAGLSVMAQTKNKIYLYDSTIGNIHALFVEYPGTNISIAGEGAGMDTSGTYKDHHTANAFFRLTGAITNRTFTVTFDKPVDSCSITCEKGTCRLTATHNPAKTVYQFFISQLKADLFSLNVYSKEKVSAQLKEVSKYIP